MPETVFFNVWRTNSPEAQNSLLAKMHSEAVRLASKPGFLSLTAWASQDENRVLVEGRWASRAHFDAAVQDSPEASKATAELEKIGRCEPGIFDQSFSFGERHPGAMIASGMGVTFVQIWEVGSAEKQDAWLEMMRERVGALTDKPGFGYMAAHTSQDGKRVAVYANWRDQASLEAGVNTEEAKAGHQALRKHGTPDGAVYRVSDVYLPDRTKLLREEASKRWSTVRFETKVIALSKHDLFVATAGSGEPLLLLHGYPQSGEIWRFVAPELAKSWQVIIPDLPGMGLSSGSNGGFDLPSVSEEIHRLLGALGLSGVNVVGHDWGGAVGAVYALRHRSNVRRFAFIESAVGGAGFEQLWVFNKPNPAMTFIPFLLTESLAETLLVGKEEVFLRHLWNTFTHNKSRVPFESWQPYLDSMKRPGLVHSSAGYYRAVYGAADSIQKMVAAGRLDIPVLSVSGDASFGPDQRTFVEAFANNIVKHVTIVNAGHFVAEEQPDALIAELRSFLIK